MPFRLETERRHSQRLILNRVVVVKQSTGQTKNLIGINYSAFGMALNSTEPLPGGEVIDLQFWLTEPENKEINLLAKVLQNYKQGDQYINRVKFIDELSFN